VPCIALDVDLKEPFTHAFCYSPVDDGFLDIEPHLKSSDRLACGEADAQQNQYVRHACFSAAALEILSVK
jgi:hypothetical protein